jgi:hypothetical protein
LLGTMSPALQRTATICPSQGASYSKTDLSLSSSAIFSPLEIAAPGVDLEIDDSELADGGPHRGHRYVDEEGVHALKSCSVDLAELAVGQCRWTKAIDGPVLVSNRAPDGHAPARSGLAIAWSAIMLGPSLIACAGSGWVSMKEPIRPAASAARASGGTNSRWPSLFPPAAPGSWTACVASKTVGYPFCSHDRERSHVHHEVLVTKGRPTFRLPDFLRSAFPQLAQSHAPSPAVKETDPS